MAWIESHQQLARHPKTVRLAAKLRINKAQAIGHLHLLWWWTLDYAPGGDLSVFTSHEISAAAEWQRDPNGFLVALKEAGWIDDDMQIHDWHDYAGKLVDERERDKARKRASRKRECPADVLRTSGGHPSDVQPPSGRTQPNPTQPNNTVAISDDENSVDEIWRSHDWGGMTQEQAFGQLEHLFPGIDVIGEYHAFKARLAKEGRKPSWKPFIGWLRKATPVVKLSKPKRGAAIMDEAEPVSEEEQLRLAEELRRAREAANL
ncbi:hypothetical protein TSACC_21691 [Terrimicrobium sacchariphilum]|uniref:Uncharacterized protein n=1 Tax=Terrimicrobium sacchariphilum TaxID=690879 RepID=A0A146G9D8_TERSA|nr:hypothetical protein [Terrimicrobium sacchariphilum]GAT33278.1 hypothetical protein TSACC_21691 [Terrimicrobium sacchariphilum]